MICNKCGAENENGALFCGSCGAKLEQVNNDPNSFEYSYGTTNDANENNANENNAVNLNKDVSNKEETNQEMSNQGFENQGMPNQGMPNQGMPNQGFQNQGMSNQGFQNQGMPNQGMPNQGFQNQGMPNPGFQGQMMPKRQITKDIKILFGLIGAAVVALVLFFVVGSILNDFNHASDAYYNAVKNYDYKTINKYTNVTDKTFLTEKNFKKSFDLDKKFTGKLVDKEDVDTAFDISKVKKFNIENEKGRSGYLKLTGTKGSSKNFLFFNAWKISCPQVVAQRVNFIVPKDAKLYINGDQVPTKYITSHATTTDTYLIPAMYDGQYSISVKPIGHSKMTVKRLVGSQVMDERPSTYFSLTRIKLNESEQKELLKQAKKDYARLLNAFVKQEDYETVKDMFATSNSISKYRYNNLARLFTASNAKVGIANIKINDIKGSISNNDVNTPSVRLSYNDKVDGVENVGTETKIFRDRGRTGYVRVTYKYDEKKGWLVNYLYMYLG
ncbi:zinc ribbon domain-containing protein [Lachnobacterium bovis]|uniref:zinc ribbon domain-containing protein n=1 Tax=Lachnobacterium bovis TaxID=140626 RepID=UPI0004869EAF|nr:zinc ribbon domain-containing protein [Lachnobacterium bovis]